MRDDDPSWLKAAERAFLNEDSEEAERITRAGLEEAEAAGDTPSVIRGMEYVSFLLMAQFHREAEYKDTVKRARELKERHAVETLRELESKLGANHSSLLRPLLQLAEVLKHRLHEGRHFQPGKVRELDELFQQVRVIHDRIELICTESYGSDSVEYAKHLMREAHLMSEIAGAPKKAIEFIRRAIVIFERQGAEPKDLRMAEFTLAGTLRDAGRFEDAASVYEQILAADPAAKTNGPVKALLAMTYERMGMTDEALALQRDVESADEDSQKSKPYLAVPHVYHLAGELHRAGRMHEAESQYRKALELHAADPHTHAMMRGLIQRDMAECLSDMGRKADAVATARLSLDNVERELGAAHIHTAASLLVLCRCLVTADEVSEVPDLVARAAMILLSLPDASLMRDAGLTKECIELLDAVSNLELTQGLSARLAMLPGKWSPPTESTAGPPHA